MTDPRPIGEIAREVTRGIWLSAIDTCPDMTARRRRIEAARFKGILTAAEAAEKLAIVEALAA